MNDDPLREILARIETETAAVKQRLDELEARLKKMHSLLGMLAGRAQAKQA